MIEIKDIEAAKSITDQEAVDLSEDSSGSTVTEDNKQSPETVGGSIEGQE
jgi:hypothetical protein